MAMYYKDVTPREQANINAGNLPPAWNYGPNLSSQVSYAVPLAVNNSVAQMVGMYSRYPHVLYTAAPMDAVGVLTGLMQLANSPERRLIQQQVFSKMMDLFTPRQPAGAARRTGGGTKRRSIIKATPDPVIPTEGVRNSQVPAGGLPDLPTYADAATTERWYERPDIAGQIPTEGTYGRDVPPEGLPPYESYSSLDRVRAGYAKPIIRK